MELQEGLSNCVYNSVHGFYWSTRGLFYQAAVDENTIFIGTRQSMQFHMSPMPGTTRPQKYDLPRVDWFDLLQLLLDAVKVKIVIQSTLSYPELFYPETLLSGQNFQERDAYYIQTSGNLLSGRDFQGPKSSG